MQLAHRPPRLGAAAIDRIRSAFGLSTEELAALFGVSRPAVQQWRTNGVPITRAADVDRVRELADVFARKFIPERVPQIVRTSGKGLSNRSVLQVIAEQGVGPVYAYLERLFSYTPR
ncbi:MAG TPA: helix-turn-helix transcriptional regulator [Candidatus Tyrphobacter sp.]